MAIGLGKKLNTADIEQILATRFRATFSHRVNFNTIGYDNVESMKEWCRKNCEGLWRSETQYALYWQFELERDATMFMLRWSGANGNQVK